MNLLETINASAEALNLRIVRTHNVDDSLIEVVIASRDTNEHVDLETVALAASAFAEAIDYEVSLDVSSEGAERELSADEYTQALEKHVYIQFVNPADGNDHLAGTLVSVDDEKVTVKVRVKHTSKNYSVERNNIKLLRLAVKL